jgi:hypothetical protein
MNKDNNNKKVDNTDKKLHISDVIKSLDMLIETEDNIVKDLAVNKMLGLKHTYCDEEKLVKYKYRVSSLKDFRNSL